MRAGSQWGTKHNEKDGDKSLVFKYQDEYKTITMNHQAIDEAHLPAAFAAGT